MDLQKLVYLEAIYRLNSFTLASKELHVSQPAITKAIKALEEDVGVELINRHSKTISFTEAGLALIEHAKKILSEFEKAREHMAIFSDSLNSSLRLGISNMVGSWIINQVYSPFLNDNPESSIVIAEYPWTEICQMVIEQQLDMAYTGWQKDFSDTRLQLNPLMESELYVVLPPKHPLAKYKKIPFEKLNNCTLAVFDKNSLINKIIKEKCEQYNLSSNLINLTNHFSNMLNMVDAGLAIGFVILDKKSKAFNKRKYALRPLADPIILNTGFISKKNQEPTKIMKQFSQYVESLI